MRPVHHTVFKTGLLLSICIGNAAAWAGEIIAHASVQLGLAEVRDVYLGEKQLSGRIRLVPVNNAAVFDAFLATVLQTDARQFAARWTRKSFREGLVPPLMMGSDAEVISFVKATPGALGYVSVGTSGVTVLASF